LQIATESLDGSSSRLTAIDGATFSSIGLLENICITEPRTSATEIMESSLLLHSAISALLSYINIHSKRNKHAESSIKTNP
jgi:hypothetical protein